MLLTGQERDELHGAVKDAVKEGMPLAIGELLGPMIHSAVRSDMRWWRRGAIFGYLLLVLGLGYAVHDNRERSTAARGVVCQIIQGGDRELYAYRAEHRITDRQLKRALTRSAEYRRLLGPAPHCTPDLTPPPKRPPGTP